MELLTTFGLLVFGILLYVSFAIWGKLSSIKDFDIKKLLKENIKFWVASLIFGLLLSIGIVYVKDFIEVIHKLGFAVEDTNPMGFVILGIALGVGSDKSSVTGQKTLDTSKK